MNNKIDTSQTRLVLELFLKNPAAEYEYAEMRKHLAGISETQIREALRALKRSNILKVSHKRGRPKGGNRIELYSISNDLDAFEKISEIYQINGIDIFIKSEYIKKAKKKFTSILLEKARPFNFKSVLDFIELDIDLSPITSIQSNFPPDY